jgi:hypothetical protein
MIESHHRDREVEPIRTEPTNNSILRQRNTDANPVAALKKANGDPYRYELIHDGGKWRAYADEFPPLLAELIPGYLQLATSYERASARNRLARRMQVMLQARLNLSERFLECTPGQTAILQASRNVPPELDVWTAPVPLVLVSAYYQPRGQLVQPVAAPPSKIVWIDPTDDATMLLSLDEAGIVVLSENTTAGEY